MVETEEEAEVEGIDVGALGGMALDLDSRFCGSPLMIPRSPLAPFPFSCLPCFVLLFAVTDLLSATSDLFISFGPFASLNPRCVISLAPDMLPYHV